MPTIHRYSFFLILCFGLMVQCRFFHQPLILHDEFLAMLESNSYEDHQHSSDLPVNDDEQFLDELFNNYEPVRTLKSTLRPNLHLPRYLRHIDSHNNHHITEEIWK
jgi:hypothetical protein